MASTSLQGITSSPASSPPEYIYDVFLGLRGKDTRNNFTSHLYSNLVQRGIDVYMDDRKLERGETIEPALGKAIEESRFSVIVFSRDYASSPWCLDELVKIVQCMKEMGQTVLPVFYDVDPSEVAEQKRGYEKAFIQHENNFEENLEKFRTWKDCLTTVANLSGWDVRNRNESESIKIIVEYIVFKLNISMPTISKYLVGIDSRLEVLNGYIGEEVGEAIFIGVCGMGGIGKTTLARVVYDRIRWQFEGSSFLANVREVFAEKDGPRRLQEQLLSEILMERVTVWDSSRGVDMIRRRLRLKKILLILDDVDDQKQLEFLAAERGWFGPGSIIIITSRDNKVLTRYDDARIYEAEKLNDDDALMLFSQKAFKNYQPPEDFMKLSKQVVGYASGLPLDLEVIGSFLHGKGAFGWQSTINRLNMIRDRLSASFSAPEYIYDVFLSFKGKDTRKNFTSHLHSNMVQRGIDVYMDDRKFERGETIEPALGKAIEESRFFIIVFSRDYASSPWCLDELVKIVQCMNETGQTVLPVFYDVDPSEVAEQKGRYEKAFIQHENNFEENLEKVRSWKDCLTTVANLSGWDVRNRNESDSIKIIVEYILFKLNISMPTISKYLVRIESLPEALNRYIGEEVGEAIFIGVCGMGGTGKTTLARVVYDRIRWQFEGSCFLENVREVFAENDGSRCLQEQLLSEILMERVTVWDSSRGVDMIRRRLRLKKILLILDDVDDQKQLEFLAAERGWFGPGSIIIITSRDNKVLTRYDDARIYEAEKLNDDDFFMLFSQNSYKNDQLAEDFMELFTQVVGYVSSLPLDLEVIGSFLHGRGIFCWQSAIDRLNEIPDRRITSSPSFSPPEYIYDVFLSFRGKDTRNNFTSHLYSNLVQRGIDVYMDDTKLERGETIEPALWKAIEESRFSVVVFSRDYASSPWCLDELVKIVQCMKEMGQTVLPVFYDVDPSEVAEQKGGCEKAFVQHENNFEENLEKVRSWKDCLTMVANLSGWDVRNRNESESIKIIVEYILFKLNISMPTISKYLVGIDSRLEVLNGYIGEEVGEAIFIGVCGMGGTGKTTLARVVYDRIRWQFEGSCFLANVREVFAENDGLRRLQEQLLSEILMERATVWDSSRGVDMIRRRLRLKKILLILDDVDDQKQLEFLAAERGWFGPGSIIIITSRDNKVLTRYDDTRIYEAEKLNDDDALMLFSQKAFKSYHPPEDFMELSKQVVGYASGLPLALEVIGSYLQGIDIHEWGSAINRINDFPDDKINGVLRISFDGLHELEKKIFLDIACFLKGFKKDRMIRILDGCGFYASIGTRALIDKSLISVSRDQVWMHNLLQIMGKEIVRRESTEEPGRRSRLWTYEDVCLALMDNTGKEKIEAIFLDMPEIKEAKWNRKAFSKMINLRLLKINNVQLSEGPEHLSNKLRFLEWHFYPSKSLPACLHVDELVELHMPNSSLEELWYGHKSAIKLEIIDLSNSLSLVKTPEFTGIPNLKRLILEGCTGLYEVHPSLGHHKKLQYVNLVNCRSVTTLPSNLEMESLEVFSLDGCSKLEKFPDIAGNMNKLMVLRLDETGITELSSSIHHLIGLGLLSMSNCKNLTRIPEGISCLKSLKKLDMSGCSRLQYIPENLGGVVSLEELDLSGTSIKQLPESIFLLKNLKVLSLDGCRRIVVMPSLSGLCSLEVLGLYTCHLREGALLRDIGCLSSLMSLDLSGNNFVSLPTSINKLSRLEMLVLEDCRMLESLLEVPSKIQTVNLNGCIRLKEIPDPIKLNSSKRSEFLCLNCWELYKHNDQGNMGFTMLDRYLQGSSNPRPGFGIAIPGNEIPGWFHNQKRGSSISIEVHNRSMGFVACVAFSAYCESPSLFCHFKANGRENYLSPIGISCNSIQVLSGHLWLFYLSFDYLKEVKEWELESFSNIELSFQSSERVNLKNCGVILLYSLHTPLSSQSSDDDVELLSDDYYPRTHSAIMREANTSNAFTRLSIAPTLRGTILGNKEN